MVNRLLDQLSFILFPGCCLICQGNSHRPLDLCQPCEAELPWLIMACPRCAYPVEQAEQLCGQCLLKLPGFSRCVTLCHYHAPIDSLISQFKYHKRHSYGRVLATLLGQRIRQAYQCPLAEPVSKHKHIQDQAAALPADQQPLLPDLIAPVPMHWRRKLSRGFNHCEQLAEQLSQQLQLPVFYGLQRIRNSRPQQGLSAEQRRRNLQGAFMVRRKQRIDGLTIALLDDVITTGSTAEALSQLLLSAGAREVHIWSLARTPLHE